MKTILIRTLCLLVIVGSLSGLSFYFFITQHEKSPPVSDADDMLASKHNNETEWIINEILSDIAEMICYKKYSNDFSPDDISITLKHLNNFNYNVSTILPGIKEAFNTTISINKEENHLWSPQVYTKFAEEVVKLICNEKNISTDKPDLDLSTLNFMLETTTEGLERENERISEKLMNNMFDVSAHEEAALLLGLFSMREASWIYTDIRRSISRMTAHLAVADALRPDTSEGIIRRYSEVMIFLLINDQKSAMEELDNMEPVINGLTRPAICRSLHAALRTRVTGDWRILENKKNLSMFESMALFRAMCASVSTDWAIDWVRSDNHLKIPVLEIARVSSMYGCTVEKGHLLEKNGMQQELDEINRIVSQKNLSKYKDLVHYLNRTDTRCITKGSDGYISIKVISEGLWAGFFQRHLMQRAHKEYIFYFSMWGVKDRAKKFKKHIGKTLEGLYLLPVFERSCAEGKEEAQKAIEKFKPLSSLHPEYFNLKAWYWINSEYSFAIYPRGRSNSIKWYSPWIPPGTIFELRNRYFWGRGVIKEKAVYIKNNYDRGPYDYKLINEYIEIAEQETKFTPEQITEIYGPLVEYNIEIMNKISKLYKEKNPDKYVKIISDICELDPGYFFVLGDYLVEQKRKEEAAAAYQKGVNKSTDNILVANNCEWLVNYYYDNGKKDKAYALAVRAAEVYSYGGLETMAGLMEKMNRIEEAEDYYLRIKERYDQTGELAGFYFRHSDVPKYNGKLKKLLKKLFPDDLKEVTLSDFKTVPKKGVIITSSSKKLNSYNLSRGDIIVALDGYLIETLEQYNAVRSFKDDEKIEFIIWLHGEKSYRHVKAKLADRKFGVCIETYKE